ncbi:MAG: hypothetical protein JNN30_10260 [Rhodanobacteraceae bacterium]|nr:hypothetical protein [Rhodanobacteraceae bacterium]
MPTSRYRALLPTLVCLALLPVAGNAATYYVSAGAADDSGNGSAAQPKKTIRAAAALMSPLGGDTVIVRPGTYAGDGNRIDGLVAGRSSAWNTVKAEIDASVRITALLEIPLGDHYLQFEGLDWTGATQKSVTGRYLKFLRCGFANGPATGNAVSLAIGTNNATPGAQYVLVEDSFAYGRGGRYNVLVYNADRVVLRRLVARHEDGWSDTQGNPQAVVSLYNSTNILTQNLLLLDSRPSGYFEAALYHPSNGPASAHIHNSGAIVLNVANSGVGWDGGNASSDSRLSDSIVFKADFGLTINGAAHAGSLRNITLGQLGSGGINDYHGAGLFNATNSLLSDINGGNFQAIAHSGNICFQASCGTEPSMNPATSGLRWLPRIEAGSALATAGPGATRVGAVVLKRLGAPGSLHGEPGFDQPTAAELWPWPQEDRIRTALCTETGITTGFCAASSLTRYVWEQLGTAIPADIYAPDRLFTDGFQGV